MQNLVFIEAYDEIETALYLAATLKDLTIAVVQLEKLVHFFTLINKILPAPVKIIKLQSRKDIPILKNVKNTDVYFLARFMNPLTVYFVQQLSGGNSIKYFHYAHYPDGVTPYHPQNIKEWLSLIHLKMLYGRYLMFGQTAWQKRFPLLSQSFFDKKVPATYDVIERNKMMEGFSWDWVGGFFDTSKYQVMYFDQPIEDPVYGYFNSIERYRQELGDAAQSLKECLPPGARVLRKYRSDSDTRSFDIGEDAPNHLPPICLYNKSIKLYLGIFSSALYDTHGGTVVSLMDMMTFVDDNIKQRLKDMLIFRSRNKILFPGNIEELKSIVRGLYE